VNFEKGIKKQEIENIFQRYSLDSDLKDLLLGLQDDPQIPVNQLG